jgi:hypothetical protein
MSISEEKVCPYKKKTISETNPNTGRRVTYERFETCAGQRCMAYSYNGCRLLDGDHKKLTR